MALRFRELPWYFQTLIFFGIAVALFLAGERLPYSPVQSSLEIREQRQQERGRLVSEVAVLQQVQARHRDFQSRVEASEQQLLLSKVVVPDEKRTDDFMRSIQEGSVNSQVAVRRLTAKPVVYQQYYAEMPIEIEIDGAFYSLVEFYDRLSRLTRVVNVGELKLNGVETTGRGAQRKYEYAPGTSVAGTCTLTTYYTPSEAELAAAAPPGTAPGRPAAGRPPGTPGATPPR
ncbi:MAG: type 4a pilus biogenesis protein PilO [Acidobacteria bacterium]|nr:type 4a pilus biogenesis protein PilO [Acidobacteriota bacterium]